MRKVCCIQYFIVALCLIGLAGCGKPKHTDGYIKQDTNSFTVANVGAKVKIGMTPVEVATAIGGNGAEQPEDKIARWTVKPSEGYRIVFYADSVQLKQYTAGNSDAPYTPPSPTMDVLDPKFEQVKIGMTRAQVTALLGNPEQESSAPDKRFRWTNPDGAVLDLHFKDGRYTGECQYLQK